MKLILASFLLIFLVFISSFLQFTMAAPAVTGPPSTIAPTPTTPSYCDIKCGARCYKAGYKKRCLKYCGICCQECKCVPSGTYGNKSECPCYRDKKNSKGTPKCP